MEETVEISARIPLDAPRVIVLKGGDRSLIYRMRRITDKDWIEYFAGVTNQAVTVNGKRSEIFESDTALLKLVDRVVTKVEGYGEAHQVKDWKDALPIRHRMAVGVTLRAVSPADATEEIPSALCELVEVKLDATWPVDGETKLFSGLVHRFRNPSIEQLARFNREAANVQVRGDGMNSISIYPSRQVIAMKLYDELIQSVDGYAVSGEPLGDDVAVIQREMDGAHKAIAALQLFAGGGDIRVQ